MTSFNDHALSVRITRTTAAVVYDVPSFLVVQYLSHLAVLRIYTSIHIYRVSYSRTYSVVLICVDLLEAAALTFFLHRPVSPMAGPGRCGRLRDALDGAAAAPVFS